MIGFEVGRDGNTAYERLKGKSAKVQGMAFAEGIDDPKKDGERLKTEVVVMVKEYRERLEAEEHVPVPKRVDISREIWRNLDSQRDVWGCMSLLPGIAR